MSRGADADPLTHETTLTADYATEPRARLVAAALLPEVGELEASRAQATVSRADATVQIRVQAVDLAALRAGVTSWSRLLAVAERVAHPSA
jgi:KEOPS complex subunit Pcc1